MFRERSILTAVSLPCMMKGCMELPSTPHLEHDDLAGELREHRRINVRMKRFMLLWTSGQTCWHIKEIFLTDHDRVVTMTRLNEISSLRFTLQHFPFRNYRFLSEGNGDKYFIISNIILSFSHKPDLIRWEMSRVDPCLPGTAPGWDLSCRKVPRVSPSPHLPPSGTARCRSDGSGRTSWRTTGGECGPGNGQRQGRSRPPVSWCRHVVYSASFLSHPTSEIR